MKIGMIEWRGGWKYRREGARERGNETVRQGQTK